MANSREERFLMRQRGAGRQLQDDDGFGISLFGAAIDIPTTTATKKASAVTATVQPTETSQLAGKDAETSSSRAAATPAAAVARLPSLAALQESSTSQPASSGKKRKKRKSIGQQSLFKRKRSRLSGEAVTEAAETRVARESRGGIRSTLSLGGGNRRNKFAVLAEATPVKSGRDSATSDNDDPENDDEGLHFPLEDNEDEMSGLQAQLDEQLQVEPLMDTDRLSEPLEPQSDEEQVDRVLGQVDRQDKAIVLPSKPGRGKRKTAAVVDKIPNPTRLVKMKRPRLHKQRDSTSDREEDEEEEVPVRRRDRHTKLQSSQGPSKTAALSGGVSATARRKRKETEKEAANDNDDPAAAIAAALRNAKPRANTISFTTYVPGPSDFPEASVLRSDDAGDLLLPLITGRRSGQAKPKPKPAAPDVLLHMADEAVEHALVKIAEAAEAVEDQSEEGDGDGNNGGSRRAVRASAARRLTAVRAFGAELRARLADAGRLLAVNGAMACRVRHGGRARRELWTELAEARRRRSHVRMGLGTIRARHDLAAAVGRDDETIVRLAMGIQKARAGAAGGVTAATELNQGRDTGDKGGKTLKAPAASATATNGSIAYAVMREKLRRHEELQPAVLATRPDDGGNLTAERIRSLNGILRRVIDGTG